jgi:hypothetical protein
MKTIPLLLISILSSAATFAQEINKELKPFTRIIASPRIHVILEKGDQENIRLVYQDVSESRINILVKGRTLHLFLDGARKVEKTVKDYDSEHGSSRHGIYEGASVTAFVTYKQLDMLEIRGNQELTCRGEIIAPEFLLRAYGENEITLASLETAYFKTALYGKNKLKINNGKVSKQKYNLYGENKIDTQGMHCEYTSTRIFGEGKVRINSSEELRVNAFGEPKIYVDGGGYVNRRIVVGRTRIYKRH